ncbi:MAG TPA: Rieske (2Fe-2S) protein, partial [Vampirovibrionales bacterium]
SKTGILIKNKNGELTSFDTKCTHLGCPVTYLKDKNEIFCNCHGGVYDPLTGTNVSGPPPKPLKAFSVTKEEDGVYVEKVA